MGTCELLLFLGILNGECKELVNSIKLENPEFVKEIVLLRRVHPVILIYQNARKFHEQNRSDSFLIVVCGLEYGIHSASSVSGIVEFSKLRSSVDRMEISWGRGDLTVPLMLLVGSCVVPVLGCFPHLLSLSKH